MKMKMPSQAQRRSTYTSTSYTCWFSLIQEKRNTNEWAQQEAQSQLIRIRRNWCRLSVDLHLRGKISHENMCQLNESRLFIAFEWQFNSESEHRINKWNGKIKTIHNADDNDSSNRKDSTSKWKSKHLAAPETQTQFQTRYEKNEKKHLSVLDKRRQWQTILYTNRTTNETVLFS